MKKYFFLFFFISFASPLFAKSLEAVLAKTHSDRLREFISGVLDANYYSRDRETNPAIFLKTLKINFKKNPFLRRIIPLHKKSSIKITLSQQMADFACVTNRLFEVAYVVARKKGPDRDPLNLATRCKMFRKKEDIDRLFGPIGEYYLDRLEQRLLAAGIRPSKLDRPLVLAYPVIPLP